MFWNSDKERERKKAIEEYYARQKKMREDTAARRKADKAKAKRKEKINDERFAENEANTNPDAPPEAKKAEDDGTSRREQVSLNRGLAGAVAAAKPGGFAQAANTPADPTKPKIGFHREDCDNKGTGGSHAGSGKSGGSAGSSFTPLRRPY